MNNNKLPEFEQGPIRPPNEAKSLLIRLTRNCPWNQCLFCPVYKNRKFSLRTVQEIKQDIQNARDIADHIKALSEKLGLNGNVNDQVISTIFSNSAVYSDNYRSIAAWLYYNTKACFLQDADNLIMKTDHLVQVLTFLREKFPEINRVTTYSRSKTITLKSEKDLKLIKNAGLDRVHIGLETGYDPLLKFIKKGVTSAQHIEAGRKCIEAGMELSEYVMPGLGGQKMWKEHAQETANVLNRINPHFIRLRSLRIPKRVPLYEKLENKSFIMQTDDMLAQEIKVFIQTLDNITSMVTSDHIMNLLEEVSGKLPDSKPQMIQAIEKYQALSDHDRLIYRIGRRGGAFSSPDDIKHDTQTREKLENLVKTVTAESGHQGVEQFITDIVDRYI
jgi:radical SAM superfamily enzyme YgiQ (UPF0313 family)